MTRAVIERSEGVQHLSSGFLVTKPAILQSGRIFVDGKTSVEKEATGKVVPSSAGWKQFYYSKLSLPLYGRNVKIYYIYDFYVLVGGFLFIFPKSGTYKS